MMSARERSARGGLWTAAGGGKGSAARNLWREALLARLRRRRPRQKAAFEALRGSFAARYRGLQALREDEFVSPLWRTGLAGLERDLLPAPPSSFLTRKSVLGMLAFPRDVDAILARLRDGPFSGRLPELLLEDWVGEVPDLVLALPSSLTQVHHLNDLQHFIASTGYDLRRASVCVEWGGGYGCMAKLVRRINPKVTYVIVDLALVSCLQWLYLSAVFGPGSVSQCASRGDPIRPGKINLVPVGLARGIAELPADLFISTFALNECSRQAQRMVLSSRWLRDSRLLLACDERSGDAGTIRRALARRGATLKVDSRGSSFFAFR